MELPLRETLEKGIPKEGSTKGSCDYSTRFKLGKAYLEFKWKP